MQYCEHGGKTFRFEMLIGLAGYNAHPINDITSNNSPYVIELSFGTLSDFNNGNISGKIYTNGTMSPFDLNGLKFDFSLSGGYHIPGSYTSHNIKIDYKYDENIKSFEISDRDYNRGWQSPKYIAESFFRKIFLLSQCKTIDNYQLVTMALSDLDLPADKISLCRINELTDQMCKIRNFISDNSTQLPEEIVQKIKSKLKENISLFKEKISLIQIEI